MANVDAMSLERFKKYKIDLLQKDFCCKLTEDDKREIMRQVNAYRVEECTNRMLKKSFGWE